VSRLTLRVVIILAGISITGITITQIYWVRKAFDVRENQFNHDVQMALRQVANRLVEINQLPPAGANPVSQLTTNYFVADVNGPIAAPTLEFLLLTEFEKQNISADFEYGIYDCRTQCMSGGKYISPSKNIKQASLAALPIVESEGMYFGVLFPHLEANLLAQMGIMTFSSVVLLVVIAFFIYTLLVILKQRRLSEVQRDFINNMTHEFKTPISTIALSSEVLASAQIIETPDRLKRYAGIIQQESTRLQLQIDRVLQMARMDRDQVQLKKEVVSMHQLLRDSAESFNLALQERGGHITLTLNAHHDSVWADALHVSNVFYNLLDNAIKYTTQHPRIVVHTENRKGELVISFEDNGIGIAKENQKRVFDRFYRVPTGNRHDVKGFGLGLHYVRQMMLKHGGQVILHSEVNQGSTFVLIFPTSSPA
jgi:two-component system phosphate regulon sensor histidine kinase PhoR